MLLLALGNRQNLLEKVHAMSHERGIKNSAGERAVDIAKRLAVSDDV